MGNVKIMKLKPTTRGLMTHSPCGGKVVAGTCGSGDRMDLVPLVAVGLMTHSPCGGKVVAGTCGSRDTHGLRSFSRCGSHDHEWSV